MYSLGGRTAAITGGGGDLCSTRSLALSGAGAKVAILDISLQRAEASAESVKQAGGTATAYACDVLDERNLAEVSESLRAAWGEPDILFIGTFLPTQVFARGMAERGSGSILNIASMGVLNPLTLVRAYSAAKAAVANFTAWLAVLFSHAGVRVNAIAPEFFLTEQLKFLHIDQKAGGLTLRAKKSVAHTPMGRYRAPEELAGAAIFLLSDAASFVTGIVLPIDGGFASYSI
jgi:NAD(P)-dependent dehydrogenase (short-subunit alcohol dehydrogenase family)